MNLTRRDFLKISAAGAASAVLLAGCGSEEDDSSTDASNTTDTDNISSDTETNNTMLSEDVVNTVEGEATTEQVDMVIVGMQYNSFSPAPFGGQSAGIDYFIKRLYGNLLYSPFNGAQITDGTCLPYLAKSIECSSDDKLTWDVELYEGITDIYGNELTASDVVYSYDRAYAEGGYTSLGQYIDNIEIVDDYHFKIHLIMYCSNALEATTAGHRIAIVTQAWYEGASDDGKLYEPGCTGPYKIISYTPGSELVIEARDDYWQSDEDRGLPGRANVKTIYFKCITEAAMRTIALQNHEVDAAAIQVAELYHFYDSDTQTNIDGWNVSLTQSRFTHYMFMNMASGYSPLADDENLRKAVLYAINPRDVYLAAGYDDSTATPSSTVGHRGMGGFNEAWLERGNYDYDLDKAKEYMAKSNYPDGLTLRFLGRPTYESMLALIANELLAINIKVELNLYEQSLFNQYKYDKTAWDLIHDDKGYSFMGYLLHGLFHSSGYEDGNVCCLKDDTLDQLVLDATVYNDQEHIDAAEEYIYEKAMCRGIFNYYDTSVTQDGILENVVAMGMLDVAAATYSTTYKSVGA